MLIIFTCWTVWWNITMTLSSSPPQWVGADIDAAISSLITCLFHFSFLHRRMPFHTTIPKRIQTMWVQYGLLSPSPPASNPESYPLPILFLQPHPTQPFPLAASVLMPPPPLRSQAPGLSVCVSEVLYGELVWQGRGKPTCMWQWLQLSSPSLISSFLPSSWTLTVSTWDLNCEGC